MTMKTKEVMTCSNENCQRLDKTIKEGEAVIWIEKNPICKECSKRPWTIRIDKQIKKKMDKGIELSKEEKAIIRSHISKTIYDLCGNIETMKRHLKHNPNEEKKEIYLEQIKKDELDIVKKTEELKKIKI